jgi:hypothetical protein
MDVLTGQERADALAHLETCAPCRQDVASLTDTVEEMLALAPATAPSHGFADRVLAAIDDEATGTARPAEPLVRPRRHHARAGSLLAAAVVVVTAVVGLFLDARTTQDAGPRTAAMRAVTGQVVGEVTLSVDPTSIVLDIPDWASLVSSYGGTVDASYWVRVQTLDGSARLERLPSPDDIPWRVDVDDQTGTVVAVSIVDDHGTSWCTAQFA